MESNLRMIAYLSYRPPTGRMRAICKTPYTNALRTMSALKIKDVYLLISYRFVLHNFIFHDSRYCHKMAVVSQWNNYGHLKNTLTRMESQESPLTLCFILISLPTFDCWLFFWSISTRYRDLCSAYLLTTVINTSRPLEA